MKKGDRIVLHNQVVTRDSEFEMNVLLTWGSDYDEPLVVMTKLDGSATSMADTVYGLRFGIEAMLAKHFDQTFLKFALGFSSVVSGLSADISDKQPSSNSRRSF